MIEFKTAKDLRGRYGIDWSRLRERASTPASRIELIPFHAGDPRVESVPAEESLLLMAGRGERLTHGLYALRLNGVAIHQALSPANMREMAASLIEMANIIEGAAK